MQLPFLKKTDPQKNFFLSLLVKPYKIGAILFEEINSKLFILATHEIALDKDTSELSTEELLEASDKAITFIEGSLPEGSTLEKTIFSVPYDWITDGKINKEHLGKLKKICDDLGLVPVGYLISIEAVVSFLAHSEGAPVSAIFVEVARKKVFVYLVRGGKVLEVHEGAIEENLLETVEMLLKKVEAMDVLPSKIILLDYKDSDFAQQEFLSHAWPKDIPFLHLPQVVVLERGFENEATINGVANQMELEVLQDVKTIEESVAPEEILEQENPSDFGFFKEKDVAKEAEKIETSEKEEKQEVHKKITEESNLEPAVSYFKEGEEEVQGEEVENVSSLNKLSLPGLSQLTEYVRKIKIPNFKAIPFISSGNGGKPKLILAVIAGIVLVVAFAFIYYNFILGAQVVIFADKKAIDKSADVVFSKNPSDDKSIKIELVDEEVKGSDTKNSTGTKETGDRATGSITVYNKTDSGKTFPKGTIIVSSNNLAFATQSDINISSTSAFSTTLSSADVKVQASEFGKEYNLPSGSNFTVKGFTSNDFIAKNSDAITGGTKKETTVVSQKDLDDLLASVTQKLEQEAIQKAKSGASQDQAILPKALSVTVESKTYSRKVNEEVGNVSVDATIKYSVGKYTQSDLDRVVESLSTGEIPGSYSLRTSDSKIDITDIKIGKDDTASGKLNVNAVYSPNIETKILAGQIKGETLTAAESKIKGIAGVTDVVINLTGSLPLLPKLLPASAAKINVEVKN